MASVSKDMVLVPGSQFTMGSSGYYPEERPVVELTVQDLLVDEHPVTNAEFRRFVKDTGYLTVAEQPPSAADFPDVDPADLIAGSLVFSGTTGPVPLDDWTRWWSFIPGTDWRHPWGPGSTLHGLERHPVVHVTVEDATAFAAWCGKRLPTEAEWEHAARGGLDQAAFAWGEEFQPRGKSMANTWQGRFPWENIRSAGPTRTTPVGTYPPNAFGLVDMTGNVWEWTASPWTPDHSSTDVEQKVTGGSCCAPSTPLNLGEYDRQVMKGGSHLCAPEYCLRYRPAARQGQTARSSTSHLGFRLVKDVASATA